MGISMKENSKDNAKDVSSDGRESSIERIENLEVSYAKAVELPNDCPQTPYSLWQNLGSRKPGDIFSF